MDKITKQKILKAQKNEITEHYLYLKLSRITKNEEHRDLLEKIGQEELAHYKVFKKITGTDIKPNIFKIWFYYNICRSFGLTFGLKFMEKGEADTQAFYKDLDLHSDEVDQIIKEEHDHELKLIRMIDEDFLKYMSSVVLGLNDALVELTGALAGFTLALKNTKLIMLVGLITGISGALSMASSEYLSTKHEQGEKHPIKAAVFTGIAYIATVFLLVSPYLYLSNYYLCLLNVLAFAIFIIFIFNYYISVTKEIPFKKHFLEMISLSLGVALASFLIGHLLRKIFSIDI